MPKFCCKYCGMITDNPEIVPLGQGTCFVVPQLRYHYKIICPVCENETRFWREKPFPTGQPKQ